MCPMASECCVALDKAMQIENTHLLMGFGGFFFGSHSVFGCLLTNIWFLLGATAAYGYGDAAYWFSRVPEYPDGCEPLITWFLFWIANSCRKERLPVIANFRNLTGDKLNADCEPPVLWLASGDFWFERALPIVANRL